MSVSTRYKRMHERRVLFTPLHPLRSVDLFWSVGLRISEQNDDEEVHLFGVGLQDEEADDCLCWSAGLF